MDPGPHTYSGTYNNNKKNGIDQKAMGQPVGRDLKQVRHEVGLCCGCDVVIMGLEMGRRVGGAGRTEVYRICR